MGTGLLQKKIELKINKLLIFHSSCFTIIHINSKGLGGGLELWGGDVITSLANPP